MQLIKLHVVIVEFTALGQDITPKFIAMQKEFPEVKIYKVNIEENTETAEAEGITAMPIFKCYRKCTKIDELCEANEDKLAESDDSEEQVISELMKTDKLFYTKLL